MVDEGVRASRMFINRAARLGVEIPVLTALGGLLDGELEVDDDVRGMVDAYQG